MTWDAAQEGLPDGDASAALIDDKLHDWWVILRKCLAVLITDTDGNAPGSGMDEDNLQIKDDCIDSNAYIAGSIDTEHIADAQITTAKIADANVTTAKLADSAVGAGKLGSAAAYASAQTRYFSVSLVGDSFDSRDAGIWAKFTGNGTRYYSVNLPHGATVTNLYSYGIVNYGTLTASLCICTKTNFTPGLTMASNTHSDDGALNDSSISYAVIDNNNYKYWAQITRANHSDTAYICSIVITYTITKPLP